MYFSPPKAITQLFAAFICLQFFFSILLLRTQLRVQAFDSLAFHFPQLRFKFVTVEGGGEVFGSERHRERRLVVYEKTPQEISISLMFFGALPKHR
ncbi:MAG: hypothetical protein LBC68_14960 [Prevotellaceae bacterium]|jgi:hypothetical protein|nr:hypothetical protein [Prevotellaceae bacterium]